MNCKSIIRCMILCLAVLMLAAFVPKMTQAAVCNGFVDIGYVSGPNYGIVGDTYRVRLTVGAGSITEGTLNQLSINRLRFELDCSAAGALGIPCTDDTAKIEYEGDGAITTTCPSISWSTGHGVSTSPNEVVFTPSAPVVINANTPNFCNVEFDVKVMGLSSADGTPNRIEEVAGYSVVSNDAACDNGLASGGSQSAGIVTCPVCNDGSVCTTDTCNQTTGQCVYTPLGNSQTPTGCSAESDNPDGNLCTHPGCNAAGQCEAAHTTTSCPADNNPCDTESCSAASGECIHTAIGNSQTPTGCSAEGDNPDGDLCTHPGCNAAGQCEAVHTTTSCASENLPDVCCDPADGLCKADANLDPICAPSEAICRTPGFWGTHACGDTIRGISCEGKRSAQDITFAVISECGPLSICGETISNTDLGSANSAVEAICVSIKGEQRLQLARQLTAAALNCCISNDTSDCTGLSPWDQAFFYCNQWCEEQESDMYGICIDIVDCLNNGGNIVDVVDSSVQCQTGTCSNGDPCGENLPPCEDLSLCVPLEETCHTRDLCNEDGLCFEPPGPAGSGKQCNDAIGNSCTIFSCP